MLIPQIYIFEPTKVFFGIFFSLFYAQTYVLCAIFKKTVYLCPRFVRDKA